MRNPDGYVSKMLISSERWVAEQGQTEDSDYDEEYQGATAGAAAAAKAAENENPEGLHPREEGEENPEDQGYQQEPALCDECQEGVYVDQSEDNPEHPRDEAGYGAYQEPEYPQFDYVDDEGNGYNDPNDGWQEDWWKEDQGWY